MDNIINIINKAETYFIKTPKKTNESDNYVVKYVIENLFKSDFIIVNTEKIIYTSSKYVNLIGSDISLELKEIVKSSCSMKKSSLAITNNKYINGIVWGTDCTKNEYTKGFLIIKFNKKSFFAEILPIIYKLKEYIYLY